MKIEQIYTGCLAQGAYYIESDGEIAIIDPLREVDAYLEKVKANGGTIKYVFETHFHADFVSGHLDLAKKSGAKIVYGPGAKTAYDIHEASDGEIFELGKAKIKVLHTPGHTLESACFLLIDEAGKEKALFSGDTLFIGDVGRPDLAQKGDLTQNDLAGMLFDSLRGKVMVLPDDVTVYPAHGAGSACGKNMSKETSDALGHQKQVNYALRADMTKEEFVKEVTEGLLPPPRYFAQNVAMNKSGAKGLDEILDKGKVPLSISIFEGFANHEGAIVLDTRSPESFSKGHIPNSIFIGIDGSFAPWVGALIPDLKQAIVFVADQGREEEVVTRLSRVGYDNTMGYLDGGYDTWVKAGMDVDKVSSIPATELASTLNEGNCNILDVRKPTEFESGHISCAINTPLDFINDNMQAIEESKEYYIHCAGGYRSMIFASILKSRGIHSIKNVAGGYEAIADTSIPLETGIIS